MMTSSNENIFRVTGLLCGEFTGPGEFSTQRPVTRSFDVLFDLHLNKQMSKQSRGWWFETPSGSLWRQCNEWWVSIDSANGFIPLGNKPLAHYLRQCLARTMPPHGVTRPQWVSWLWFPCHRVTLVMIKKLDCLNMNILCNIEIQIIEKKKQFQYHLIIKQE